MGSLPIGNCKFILPATNKFLDLDRYFKTISELSEMV